MKIEEKIRFRLHIKVITQPLHASHTKI